MSPEVINLFGGAVLGIAGKFISVQAKRNESIIKHLSSKADIQEKAYNAAVKRVPVGARNRQSLLWIIMLSIFGGILIATPFNDIPVTVMTETERGFFGRLFGPAIKTTFHEVRGFFLHPDFLEWASAIVGFVFGQSIIKR